jgi:hypothetical protein
MEQSPLLGWESFYVVVGTGAAALIGLQFVVIVLSAEMHALGSSRTTRAFATPTDPSTSVRCCLSRRCSARPGPN